jgi:hypothetical protein
MKEGKPGRRSERFRQRCQYLVLEAPPIPDPQPPALDR